MSDIASYSAPYSSANYSNAQVRRRIVHIGLGAFHRAHMAWACHELLQKGHSDWGICAVSLRGSKTSLSTIASLEQQNYRYLLGVQDARTMVVHEVSSIVQALDAVRDGIEAVTRSIAAAETAILSFTVTEKGYYIDAATRRLDEKDPAVQHDLAEPQKPCTLLGFLSLGLLQRLQNGANGLALMSCDNIPENSRVLQRSLLRFVALLAEKYAEYAELLPWLERYCSFPCTMVDRITPAANEDTLRQIAAVAGKYDPIGLTTEKFTQWVIEDDFPAGRPLWQNASGVTIVPSGAEVGLYEEMKLRMLNGSHSFLAYCGYLAGKEYIFECIEDETLRAACYQFITEEQLPTLELKGDLLPYAEQLIERYSNPHILHRCYQIAMDGSLKIPQRWLDGYRSKQKSPWRYLAFALSAWLQYLKGRDLAGGPIEVQDPHAQPLRALLEGAKRGREAETLFSFAPTFGDLHGDTELIAKVQDNYEEILLEGIIPTLKKKLK